MRWYEEIKKSRLHDATTGTVVVGFRLHGNGQISQMQIIENKAGELAGSVCLHAINESAPFPEWPEAMRKEIGTDFRDVKFTFQYR